VAGRDRKEAVRIKMQVHLTCCRRLKDQKMKQRILTLALGLLIISWAPPTIELVKRNILKGKVEVLLPKDFEVMPDEMVRIKYNSDTRPTLVYSDKTGEVNVAFDHSAYKATQQQMGAFKDNFVSSFKQMHPSAEWKASGVQEINGRKIGFLELITPATDTRIYNLIFFTDLEGRLLLCTFNCVAGKHKEWMDQAHQIMKSLSVR
jgi:hypothetical protein